MKKPTSRLKSQISETSRPLHQRVVVQEHHPAFAGRYQLVGVKTETAGGPEAANESDAVLAAVRLRRVFDHVQPALIGKVQQRLHVNGVAIHVDGHDGARSGGDALVYLLDVHRPRARIGVYEDWSCTGQNDGPDTGDDRER